MSPTDIGIKREGPVKAANRLPYFAAAAWYHKALSAKLQVKDLDELLPEIEQFTLNKYMPALAKGGFISSDEKQQIADQVAQYSGLSVAAVLANNLDINTIRWLENILTSRKSTMIIISHDRHFLNSVCTHMADIDYGELRVYPGNYEYFLEQSSLLREQLLSGNVKKAEEIAELQDFVNRFGANASKAKQASSRAKKMDKIKLDDVKSSSRITPKIAFAPGKKMHRQALELENLGHGFDGEVLFEKGELLLKAGAKLAIIGENGVGKTTLLRCLMSELSHNEGVVKWSENASVGYCPQDSGAFFDNDLTLMDWMSQWRRPCHNDLSVRGMLGRLLFTDDDANKKARNCSGGEKNRLLFGKLMMADINVLIMDEPTNHMDIEAIDALNNALKDFEGTLIFVSHDREFVSSLATRIIDIKDKQLVNFEGSLDEYLSSQINTQKVA